MFIIVVSALYGLANGGIGKVNPDDCCDYPTTQCPDLIEIMIRENAYSTHTATMEVCTNKKYSACHSTVYCSVRGNDYCYNYMTNQWLSRYNASYAKQNAPSVFCTTDCFTRKDIITNKTAFEDTLCKTYGDDYIWSDFLETISAIYNIGDDDPVGVEKVLNGSTTLADLDYSQLPSVATTLCTPGVQSLIPVPHLCFNSPSGDSCAAGPISNYMKAIEGLDFTSEDPENQKALAVLYYDPDVCNDCIKIFSSELYTPFCNEDPEVACWAKGVTSIADDTVQAFCNETPACQNTSLCFFPGGKKCYMQYQILYESGYDLTNPSTLDSAAYEMICSSGYPCFSGDMSEDEYALFCVKIGNEWCAPKAFAAEQAQKEFEGMDEVAILLKYQNDPVFCNLCMEEYRPSLNTTDAELLKLLCPDMGSSPIAPTASPPTLTSSSTSLKLSSVFSIVYVVRMLL